MPSPAFNPPQADASRLRARRWRLATLLTSLLLALAVAAGVSLYEQFKAQVAYLHQQLKGIPQVSHLAVLLDAQHQPAMLATLNRHGQAMALQRLNEVREGRADSLQLWALNAQGQAQSLGVLTAKLATMQVQVSEQDLHQAVELAISVEAKGGTSASQGPRLPFLFRGHWIRKAL